MEEIETSLRLSPTIIRVFEFEDLKRSNNGLGNKRVVFTGVYIDVRLQVSPFDVKWTHL